MAQRTINWTRQALIDRISILEYWIQHNKSKTYSIKLDALFVAAVQRLSGHPETGRKIEHSTARAVLVRNYLVIYDFSETDVDILVIWDAKQDPRKLKKRLKR